MALLDRLRKLSLPHFLGDPGEVAEARELHRLGQIEAQFDSRSKGLDDYGQERGALVLKITEPGWAAPR